MGERSRLAKAKGLEGASVAWLDSIDLQTRGILGSPVQTLLANFARRSRELSGEGDVIVDLPRRKTNPLLTEEEDSQEVVTTRRAGEMVEEIGRAVSDFRSEIGTVLSVTYVQFAEAGHDAAAAEIKELVAAESKRSQNSVDATIIELVTAKQDVRGFNKKAGHIELNSIHQARALKGRLEGSAVAILEATSGSDLMEIVELLRDDIKSHTDSLAKRLVRNATV